MPTARIHDIDLYYEVSGTGDPLLLIRGLGSNADHWYCQIPAFSKHFKVITFDHRGIARSGFSNASLTMALMTGDVIGLLDFLKISRAHIFGISMGGMIAQQMAISYPQRIGGLVLGCTHCGGNRVVRTSNAGSTIKPEQLYSDASGAAKKALNTLFADATITKNPAIFSRYLETSAKYPPDPEILKQQREAIHAHDAWEDLPHIQSPTLILTGDQDRLVPVDNAKLLRQRIPNSSLEIVNGGGHQFMIEQPDITNKIVVNFLKTCRL
jgi:pimeloyl-ACP methyl ester carboxylesterase